MNGNPRPARVVREVVTSVADERVGALPVIDEHGRVTGVVSEADLLRIRTARMRCAAPHHIETAMA